MYVRHVHTDLQSTLNGAETELQTLRESNLHQKKRNLEMMISLIRDLGEIGVVLEKADGGLVVGVILLQFPS